MKLTQDLRKIRMADVCGFMSQIYNNMASGETLEVEVPDFLQICARWQVASEAERWKTIVKEIYGPQDGQGIFLSGYNKKTLTHILTVAGFQNVNVKVVGPMLVCNCTK